MNKISEDIRNRIMRLREHVLNPPEVCVEKARYMTQSYKLTEGEPSATRRAKALENILSNMTLTIMTDELLVGRVTSKPRGGAISPEINCRWYLDQLDLLSSRPNDRFQPIPQETKDEIKEIVDYWQGKSLCDYWEREVSDEAKEITCLVFNGGAFSYNTQYFGHFTVRYEKILDLGIKGICKEIDEKIKLLDEDRDKDKVEYLKAMKTALGASVTLAHRYADLAEKMSRTECSEKRAEELKEISRICRKVPEYPAESFREAIQSVWFVYIALVVECWGASPCFDRIDQYLCPYYKEDVEKGVITEEEAFLLVSMLLIKCNEQLTVYHTEATKTFGGMTSRVSVNLGGRKRNGSSAVNELSYLFIEAERIVACGEDMVVQVDNMTPDDFLALAIEVARDVHGKIKFVGDEVIEANLLSYGLPEDKIPDLVVTGCNTMGIPGITLDMPGGVVNLPLMLELAMNNGYSPYLGKQLGPKTGDASGFKSWEGLFDAFKRQFDYFIPYISEIRDKDKELYGEYMQAPFQSALYDMCIEQAKDVTCGPDGVFMAFGISLAGAPNVGDSLEAVKKAVFDDKSMSMERVIEACNKNFDGYENELRILKEAPKFGNDIDEVDRMVDEVLSYCSDKTASLPGYIGARSTVAAAAITSNIAHGKNVGAQPDGRRAGTPLSEGGISPHQGRNISGPTATLKSVAKLNHRKLGNGSVLNMRFDPEALNTREKVSKLASMVKAFHDMGGYLVQFNIVSTETLREAQKHPEDYKDLIVRVATYSAYFIELSRELQDDIISRLEFGQL